VLGGSVTDRGPLPSQWAEDRIMDVSGRDFSTVSGAGSFLRAPQIQHPEWRRLLAMVEAAVREAARLDWARFVPSLERAAPGERPLLDGAVIAVERRPVQRWVRRLLALVQSTDASGSRLRDAVGASDGDALVLFESALRGEDMGGVGPLLVRPLLQACRRAWASGVTEAWRRGDCPVCGHWPTLAEIRGLAGRRHLRCGACGADWPIRWLRCPFCGDDGHEHLGVLASTERADGPTVSVCDGCRGYLKTLTTLAPIRPRDVPLHDLATLALDVAALERGYRRPAQRADGLDIHVVVQRPRLRALLGPWA
jgi:FdhE protein